jgi:hypothetical protein
MGVCEFRTSDNYDVHTARSKSQQFIHGGVLARLKRVRRPNWQARQFSWASLQRRRDYVDTF